jgi:hypothetical protein
MSRDPRPSRSGAGAYPPSTRRYEEYEDDYGPTSRYYSQDPPASSAKSYNWRNKDYDPGLSTGSTNTSSGGSLLDRMKVKSYDTSSRASLDDDYDSKPRQPIAPTWARKPGAGRQQRIPEERREERQEGAYCAVVNSVSSPLTLNRSCASPRPRFGWKYSMGTRGFCCRFPNNQCLRSVE